MNPELRKQLARSAEALQVATEVVVDMRGLAGQPFEFLMGTLREGNETTLDKVFPRMPNIAPGEILKSPLPMEVPAHAQEVVHPLPHVGWIAIYGPGAVEREDLPGYGRIEAAVAHPLPEGLQYQEGSGSRSYPYIPRHVKISNGVLTVQTNSAIPPHDGGPVVAYTTAHLQYYRMTERINPGTDTFSMLQGSVQIDRDGILHDDIQEVISHDEPHPLADARASRALKAADAVTGIVLAMAFQEPTVVIDEVRGPEDYHRPI